ncbi:MAG: hypothetical protein RBR37_08420 [Advenella sp.]|nr:hypothetical protein [Advenella sp.]
MIVLNQNAYYIRTQAPLFLSLTRSSPAKRPRLRMAQEAKAVFGFTLIGVFLLFMKGRIGLY